MIKKLYRFVEGKIQQDKPDSPSTQELLIGGHVCSMLLRENLETWLNSLRLVLLKQVRLGQKTVDITSTDFLEFLFRKTFNVGKKFEYFLATGNLVSRNGMDLRQTTGFSVVAEKLNYMRWMAHYRCVHRGQFFAQMRTTTVRKLLPDSWGFLCPVHTPDGGPCGLLNHLAAKCIVTDIDDVMVDRPAFTRALCDLGMIPNQTGLSAVPTDYLPVVWNGCILGYVPDMDAESFGNNLRLAKV